MDLFLKVHRKLGQQYYFLCEGLIWQFRAEDSQDFFDSGMVISKNYLEGQKSHNVQDVQMQPF